MSGKKAFLLPVVLLFACSQILFSGGSQEGEKAFTLRVGMVVTESDPMFKGAMELKKNVEARTNKKLLIEVYPSSQLGDLRRTCRNRSRPAPTSRS